MGKVSVFADSSIRTRRSRGRPDVGVAGRGLWLWVCEVCCLVLGRDDDEGIRGSECQQLGYLLVHQVRPEPVGMQGGKRWRGGCVILGLWLDQANFRVH